MWDKQWLSKRTEDIVDPDVEVVDAHMHLWDDKKPRLPDYLMPEFHADTNDGHTITQAVYVECGWAYNTDGPAHLRPVGETEAVAACADQGNAPTIDAIVPFADLTHPELAEAIDAHEQAAGGRLRGIRQSAAYDVDESVPQPAERAGPDLMESDAFMKGLSLLGDRGLPFDVFIYHPQISQLARVARAAPDTTIVLEHLGAPLSVGRHAGKRDEVLAEWRDSITELSECPNVFLKVGGIGWPPIGFGFEKRDTPASSQEMADAWHPFIAHGLSSFGPERCLAESNFPVDQLSCTYRILWNAIKLSLGELSKDDQQQVLSGTARSLYQI